MKLTAPISQTIVDKLLFGKRVKQKHEHVHWTWKYFVIEGSQNSWIYSLSANISNHIWLYFQNVTLASSLEDITSSKEKHVNRKKQILLYVSTYLYMIICTNTHILKKLSHKNVKTLNTKIWLLRASKFWELQKSSQKK